MRTALIFVSVLLVGISTLSLLMPWYTRPELFFGVTVRREFRSTAPAGRIVRGYCAGICGVTAVALAIVLVMYRPVSALFAHILGTCVTLIAAHHAASRYASPRASAVEVDLSTGPERMPGGGLAPLLPLAWLLSLAIWAALNSTRLPSRIAVHWGMQGPDRWVTTSPQALVTMIGLPGLVCLVFAGSAYGILHWSRRISTSGSAASSERQFRRLTVLLMLTVEYLIAILPLLMLLDAPRYALRSWGVILWITLIAFLVRLARAGQGGSRLVDPAARAPPVGDRTDDAHWLGGIIYVNSADHALFVEKRMGIGWTLNFGHLWAWLLLAGMLAIPLLGRLALPRSPPDASEVRAQAAALSWLGSIDAGEYTLSWDTAAPLFKRAVPEAQWVSRISALRGRLGVLKSRRVSSTRFVSSLPGAPNGQYVVIKFSANFEYEPDAIETVTPMRDADGQWRVSGYYLK